MSRQPRGTVVSVRYLDSDPDRPKKWAVCWSEYEPGRTGRPKQRAKTYATREEAEVVQQQILTELAQPTPITAPVQTHHAKDTLAAFAAEEWLPYVKKHNAGGTHKNYKYCFNHWIAPPVGHKRYPGLGTVLLRDDVLTKALVIKYFEGLQEDGLSLSLRKRLLAALSACLGRAFYLSKLKAVNPCSKLGQYLAVKGERATEATPNPFTPDEITRIFDQLHAVEDLSWRVFFLWQYHVGTRPGEASALKWTALDLPNKRALIEYAYCAVDRIDKDPKTHERRHVDLTAAVVELLIEWRQVQREGAFKRGYPVPEYVFTTLMAARYVPRQLARILQGGSVQAVLHRTLAACGITGHTLYDFRDSFATSHLVLGWDRKLAWVSKQLGHKTPDMTKEHYYAYRDTVESRTFADEIGGWK